MASEKTSNIGLNKWVPSDYVKVDEFNDNFDKIDEVAADHAAQLAEKAQQEDVDRIDSYATNAINQVAFTNRINDHRFEVNDIQVTSDSSHNAFTAMFNFNGTYIIAYRKGTLHDSYDGKLVYKTSTDLINWSAEQTLLQDANFDFRDPFFEIFNGNLVLKYVKRWGNDYRKTNIIYTSDLVSWSTPVELPFPTDNNPNGYNASRGNMTVYKNELYVINYGLWNGTYLIKTSDLVNWSIVTKLLDNTDEACLIYHSNVARTSDSKFIAIFRQTNTEFVGNLIWGESKDGITWTYKRLGLKAHCPTINLIKINSDSYAFAVTYRDPSRLIGSTQRVYFNFAILEVTGELLMNPYTLFFSTKSFDNGYGSIVQTSNGDLFISAYRSNGSGGFKIEVFQIDHTKLYNQLNDVLPHTEPTMTYLPDSGSVSTKSVHGWYLGDKLVTFASEKTKTVTIDLSSFNFSSGAVTLMGIYAENQYYDVRVNSVTNTAITFTITYDGASSTSSIRVRYSFIWRS